MSQQNLRAIGISFALSIIPVILLAFGLLPAYGEYKYSYDLLFKLPYLLIGLVALLGWRLNSTRILFVSLAFLLGYALLSSITFNAIVRLRHEDRASVATLALPLSMVCIFTLGERRLLSRHGLLKLGVVILPFLLLILGLRFKLHFLPGLLDWRPLPHLRTWRLSGLAQLSFVAFGITAALYRDRYIQYFSLSSLVALVPLMYGFNRVVLRDMSRLEVNLVTSLTFSGASLVLIYAVYRLYWQKVYIDELTGVPNRRALDEALAALDGTYTVAMVDIDHFKKFNDTYGHEQGDHVLRLVAAHFDRESGHHVYRYGGEEFCLLYAGARAEDMRPAIDGIRSSLAQREFTIRSSDEQRAKTSWKDRGSAQPGTKIRITVSIGVADSRPGRKLASQDAIRHADGALYQAKKAGRNRVIVDRGEGPA
ncbi:MAG TPA: GGDEF domain-containing protein [Bdellovibrionota bacterium]|jgi:diguanylate cyclase (GGDEF)-like protein|nr:GGDEF domain-containing protein [Bdellovibrionota bacterium]